MRSTVSGPVHSCSTPLSSPKKYAAVELLTRETLYFTVEPKSRAKELFAQVCLHLGNQGMLDVDLFGLAIASDGEYLFVDPDNKLSKYAPKNWRSSHGQGLDANGCPLLVLHFRVQFYVDSPLLLREKVTRHHYYLQLRLNALSADRWQAGAGGVRAVQPGGGGGSIVDEEEGVGSAYHGGGMGPGAAVAAICLLAGLALQADLGDRVEGGRRVGEDGLCGVRRCSAGGGDGGGVGSDGEDVRGTEEEEEEGTDEEVAAANEPYFDAGEYLPPQLEQTMAVRAVEAHHRGLRGLSRAEAELQYIREAAAASSTPASSWAPEAAQLSPPQVPPLRLNLHLYRLNKSKKPLDHSGGGGNSGGQSGNSSGPNSQPVWLGICAKGIEIYEENEEKAVMATFQWSNIGKLCFERKKFEIRALNWPGTAPRKFTYYSNSDEKSKHLLSLCRLTHQFSMAMQPRLAEVRRREEEERKRMRDLCPLLLELSIAKEGSGSRGSHHRGLASHTLRHALFPGHVGGHRVHGTHGSQCKGHGDQRVSVISNTSSNTTSGIVSDRVQSLDESEDDLEMEIMINSPPAPSVESLALAHLRDDEDSPIPPPTSPSPAPSADSQGGILDSLEKEKEEDASNISPPRKTSGAPTPPTDGSQCSSSCSTVVNPSCSSATTEVTSTTPAPTRAGSAHSSCSLRSGHSLLSLARSSSGAPTSPSCHGRVTPHRHQNRRASPGSGHVVTHPHIRTASDMSAGTCSTGSEIGYGHTAQNSMGSSPGEAGNCSSEFASSLTTEVVDGKPEVEEQKETETMVEEGNSTCQETQNIDYSVQSAHTYGCPPRRRSTVSSTLDTDSDYVRLPLRPITSMSTDSDSFLAPSPTPPPPPPRDESSGAKVGSYVFLEPAPRSISMGCVTGMPNFGDEPDGRMLIGSSYSLRPPPPPPPPTVTTITTTSEANARFITTRPHINILKAHTSTAPSVASPSFAAPTAAQQQLRAYPPGDARTHPPAVHPRPPQLLPSPVVTRGITLPHHPPPHRHLSIGSTGCAEDLAAKMKPTVTSSSILPVIGPNNYLDVHASKVIANHRHNHHHHQQHPKQRSGLLRGTIQSPKKSHQVSRGHPVSPVVSPLPSPLMAHQSRQQASYLCAPNPACGVPHRRHHHHHHHHHHAPCIAHHAVPAKGGSPGTTSPVTPQPTLATVYTNQVTQSQIEQYKQQLYSDVDYVIYPMKDPALSKQEYMDAKQGSTLMAHLQQQQYSSHHHHHHFHGAYPTVIQPPPPPYRSPTKLGVLYRSTPNVSGGTVANNYGVQVHHPTNGIPYSQHRIVPAPKYASNQNLSCGGGSSASTSTNSTVNSYLSEMAPFPALRPFLSTQSLALTPAPACSFYSSSTQNLTCGVYEHHNNPPPPPPPPIPMANNGSSGGEFMQVSIPTLPTLARHLEFGRTRSDDNILNIDKHHETGRQFYRLPPPPPYDPSVNSSVPSVNGTSATETLSSLVTPPKQSPSSSSSEEAKKADGMLDIRTLREKSKNLDLPLISALCNDRSLLKQTNAFVAHPGQREGEGAVFGADTELQIFGKGRPVSWHVESTMSPSGEAHKTHVIEETVPTVSAAGEGAIIKQSPSVSTSLQSPQLPVPENLKPRTSRGHLSDLKMGGSMASNGGSCSTNLAAFAKSSKHSYSVSPSKKYPVSGLSTTQISKPQRKVSSCTHTHPQDPRVQLVPGATTLAAAAGGANVVIASLKGTVGTSKARIGLKQKANVVP